MKLNIFLSVLVMAAAAMHVSTSSAESVSPPVGSGNRQILVVVTNHSSYPSRPDSTGLWLTELTHFTDVVEAAGYSTVFASPKGGNTPLDQRSMGWFYMDESARQHMKSVAFRMRLANTVPISDIDPSQFSAIYLTGGHGVMWDFPGNPGLIKAIEKIYSQGGVVSAVCHGVSGLLDVRDDKGQFLVKNRVVTGFSNREEFFSGMKSQVPFFLQNRLVDQGALYQSGIPFMSYVVKDERLITGQNPQSAEAVAKSVVDMLASQKKKP